MAQDVADYLLERLRQWNVRHVFAYPGDGINGIVAAFGRANNNPQFIQARHEEMAAFEATGLRQIQATRSAYAWRPPARAPSICSTGSTTRSSTMCPVVAIVGQTARSAMGGKLPAGGRPAQPVQGRGQRLSGRGQRCQPAAQCAGPGDSHRAHRRAPTALVIPSDLQEEPYSPPGHEFKQVPSSDPNYTHPVLLLKKLRSSAAAGVLNAGSKVAILDRAGRAVGGCEVLEVAELTGAGVAKALLGKDVLPDDLPYVTGSIGLLGTRPSYELMRDCDTLLIVGSNFPYSQFLPDYGQARAVQIDIDGSLIGMRYPTEANIVADASATLKSLIPLLERKADRSWRETVEKNVARWWETIERQSMLSAKPVNPMRIAWELSERLPANAIVTADSGSSTNWYARCVRFRDGVRGSLSGTLATMGPAVPYAIGAKFAHPDRPVIAMVGDGAMQMNGLAELLTIARYRDQWSDQRLIICVFHNNDLNQVTWELRAMGGAPKFEESQSLPDVSYADVARTMGLNAIAVDTEDGVADAWEQALAADRPTVLDIRCDPEVPPIPPHATYEQIKEMTAAVLKGDPNAWHLIYQGAKTKAQEFVPHRNS